MRDVLALDRQSTRTLSDDGHLHVARAAISKAAVNPYYGREIPGYRELGLDANRVYRMYRPAEELQKAAHTCNGKPLLETHLYTSAREHKARETVGAIGTDAAFEHPYLYNSLSIWTQGAIDGVTTNKLRELSCGYHYTPDMTPGTTTDGIAYDGRMQDIVFNHVALVERGRAGPDCHVGDSAMKLTSVQALMAGTAVNAAFAPRLAQGMTLALDEALKDVTAADFDAKRPDIAKAIAADAAAKAAEGEVITAEDVDAVLAGVQKIDPKADKLGAQDAAPPKPASKADPVTAGITQDELNAALAATARTVSDNLNAIAAAKEDVRPRVGALTGAFDSAAAVYKIALDHAKVDLSGVPDAAYGALYKALPVAAPPPVSVAMDAAAQGDYAAMFPDANRLN